MNREEILKKSRAGSNGSEEWESHLWLRGLNVSHYIMVALSLLIMVLSQDQQVKAAVGTVAWTTITANYVYQFFKDRRIGTLLPLLLCLLTIVFWKVPDFIRMMAG